ncbi:MAG: hypothetical protein IJQ44_05590 [Bacteroidaceae bacterium]|nr:hypothetical protein [Bacteroidaceae bacterium]
MLKELLHLWFLQQRRQFRWARVLTMAYFMIWMLIVMVAVIIAMADMLRNFAAQYNTWFFIQIISAILILPDMMMKVMFNDSAPIMDDCLRTKPVPGKAWSQFTALTTLIDYWNWMMPLLTAIFSFAVLPFGVALTATLLVALQSQMLAWLVTDIHKAPGNQYTLPLWAGLIFYFLAKNVLGGIVAALGIYAHEGGVSLSWLAPAAIALVAAIDVLLLWLLYRYFGRMRAYDEHTAHTEKARRIGEITLFSTEYLGVWRSKRFRLPILLISALFLFQAYQQQSLTIQQDFGGLNIGIYFALCWPSLFLGQWVFGIEANYFHGLWTKPYSIEQLLRRKFYFMLILTSAMALFLVPALFWFGLSLTRLLSLLLFVAFAQNLMMMPTCLLATRVDLFSSAFFNYQGANKGVNLYGLLVFIPVILYTVATILLKPLVADAIFAGIGLVGVALYRPSLRWLANRWISKRHEHMERYCQ